MASVYVSGDITKSLVQFKNQTVVIDGTYYGNYQTRTSADIPGSTRIIETAAGEYQKNGTYYSFQSASSWYGDSSIWPPDNDVYPDTFCPLGWRMPYGGTGGVYYDKSKSWNYLFNEYSITNNQAGATKAKSYPLSFIIGGSYHWGTGLLNDRGVRGEMWSSTFAEKYFAYKPALTDTNVYEQLHDYRNFGASIRSVYLLVFLHRRHGGGNTC